MPPKKTAAPEAEVETTEPVETEAEVDAPAAPEPGLVTVTCVHNPNVSIGTGMDKRLAYGETAELEPKLAEFLIGRRMVVEGRVNLPPLDNPVDPNELVPAASFKG